MVSIEIIAVGNELLIGDVLDTNSHWLCGRLTHLGGSVTRVVLVRDERDAIIAELRSSLARKADLIFVTGGLGPTSDDRTLDAVAAATGIPLLPDEEALSQVREKYEAFARQGFVREGNLTKEREKMAILPKGALALSNPVGAAPGAALRIGSCRILCLPGVPAEMKGIFETSLQPILSEVLGKGAFVERAGRVGCGDESLLAPLVRDVAEAHPGAYLKSRPQRFGSGITMLVTVSATGSSREEAARRVQEAWDSLSRTVARAGLSMESLEG